MSKSGSIKGEGKRHYPPAYYKYQKKKPGIFLRISREQKQILDNYRGSLSYGQAIINLISEYSKEHLDYENKRKRFVDDLKESRDKIGVLHPVIRTEYGIADGKIRKEAFPDWKEVIVNVNSAYEYYRLMANVNLYVEKPREWWKDVLNKAAEELVKMGRDPAKGEVYSSLVKGFGLRKDVIDELLDVKYKPKPI